MNLSVLDTSIVFLSLFALLGIAFSLKKKKEISTTEEYFVAGRKLTLPLFVATLVTTWYGGTLGVVQYAYDYGIVNWLTQGAFWYVSYLLFAFFLAKRINASRLYTIPDQLEKMYDRKTATLGALINVIMTTPAPYILSIGVVASFVFGVPLWMGALFATLIMLVYTLRGGFHGVVLTDALQFFLMFLGIALLFPFLFSQYGGWSFIGENVPPDHLTLTGSWSTQLIIVWGFLAMWTLVSPNFYQRCYAAKNPQTAQKGIFVAMIFWVIFDLMTTAAGLYAKAILPDLAESSMALIQLAQIALPTGIFGLFLAGLLASLMSTADSFTLSGAITLSHDLYRKTFFPNATEKQVIFATKIGIVFVAAFAFCIATLFDSILGIIYTIGTVGVGALLVPLLFGFFGKRKKSATAAFYSMLLSLCVSIPLLIIGYKNMDEWGFPQYLSLSQICGFSTENPWLTTGIEPMYPALFVSLLSYLLLSFLTKKKI